MAAELTPEDELRAYFRLQPKDVASALTPVRAERMAYPYLLHISKDNKIEKFVPSVTKRSLDGEDRSIPRISTAPTVAGCIMGYASDIHDFMERPTCASGDGQRKVRFAGGWAIYGIPFEFALVPDKTLLPDVKRTDEHWLVNYSPRWTTYPAQILGKFYYEEVRHVATAKGPVSVLTIMLEVLTDTPILFDRRTRLTRGYWKLSVQGLHLAKRWDEIESVEAEPMDPEDYTKTKQRIASMLDYEDRAPPVMAWI